MTTTTISLAGRPPDAPSTARTAGRTMRTAIAPVVWGTTYLVTTELLPPGHPVFAAAARALPAGLLAIALARTLPRGSWWWRSAVLGVLNIGAFFPLLFVAAERLPGGVAATLGATQPLVVAVLAVAVLGERWSAWRLAWGAVGVLGVGLVVLGPAAALDPVGVAAGLGGAAVMAFGVTLTKRWGRPPGAGPMAFAGWQLTAGGLALSPFAVVEGVPSHVDGAALAGYLWLGLAGGLAGYTLWFAGIRVLPVTATALLGLLSPLTAAALGAAVLGEALRPVQLLGFAVALLALVAGQLTPRPLPPTRARAPRRATAVDPHVTDSRRDPLMTTATTAPAMRLAILGATGTVGSRLVDEAAARGHHVRAVARRPGTARPGVTPVRADVGQRGDLAPALDGADAAVLAVRLPAGREAAVVDLTAGVLDVARAAGVPLLVVGGAGPLEPPDRPGTRVVDDARYVPPAWRDVAAASTAQLDACERHEAGWTYLSPPAVLEPGARTGRYRRGTTTLLTAPDGTSRISAEDLAVAVVDELESPGGEPRFTVAW